MLEFQIGNAMLALLRGDITKVPADAIGNAANAALRGGGGVDGAIHRAGGPSLMQELQVIRERRGGCTAGDAVVTGAGRLPAKWVLHAVGPIYRDGTQGEARILASCYGRCLELADGLGARSVTFPAISTGVYAYPLAAAAEVAVRAAARRLLDGPTNVERVTFVLFDDKAFRAFQVAAERDAPPLAR